MRKYRQISYSTLFGLKRFIDLGDFGYKEWIIYNNAIPKYHVNCFRENSASDAIINGLLSSKLETIESIMDKINKAQATKLSFIERPFLELVKKIELVELDLIPLPESWVENI